MFIPRDSRALPRPRIATPLSTRVWGKALRWKNRARVPWCLRQGWSHFGNGKQTSCHVPCHARPCVPTAFERWSSTAYTFAGLADFETGIPVTDPGSGTMAWKLLRGKITNILEDFIIKERKYILFGREPSKPTLLRCKLPKNSIGMHLTPCLSSELGPQAVRASAAPATRQAPGIDEGGAWLGQDLISCGADIAPLLRMIYILHKFIQCSEP